jgi:hypothetical protein
MGFQTQIQGSLPAINAVLHGAKISGTSYFERSSYAHDRIMGGNLSNARYTKRAQRRTQANDQLIESPTARTVGSM